MGLGRDQVSFGLHVPIGCERCDQEGYVGRTALLGLWEPAEPLRLAVRAESDAEVLRQSLPEGARERLGRAAVEKLRAGVTSPQEVAAALRT
jgi:general secretion pathway protein E